MLSIKQDFLVSLLRVFESMGCNIMIPFFLVVTLSISVSAQSSIEVVDEALEEIQTQSSGEGNLKSDAENFIELLDSYKSEADRIVNELRSVRDKNPQSYLDDVRKLKEASVSLGQYLLREGGLIDEIERAIADVDRLERQANRVDGEEEKRRIREEAERVRTSLQQDLSALTQLIGLLEKKYDLTYDKEEFFKIMSQMREYGDIAENFGEFIDGLYDLYNQMDDVLETMSILTPGS